MRAESIGIRRTQRHVCAALASVLLWGFSGERLKAQTAEMFSGVKRVAVVWPGSERGSAAVRDVLVRKLKASGAVEIVGQEAQADAVLHGDATLWVAGYVSFSPRSKSAEEAIYRGYASAEVTGKDGKILWSHLVTPRPVGWRTITDDLADQLAHEFLEALREKTPGEKAAGASSVAHGNGAGTVVALSGAGSTFAAPMYQKWFENFTYERPEIRVQYAAVGSEEGMKRVLAGQTDFGGTDMPLSEKELNAPSGRVLQIATMLGAVVPIYNVKGAADGLNLTPEVLGRIFLGKITRWNAPEIRAINKRAHLPDEEIEVIHRSDGSGTTFAWTDYLSKVSAEWKSGVGAGTTVRWPVGKGAEHNEGVAVAVRDTPNSIGYVEFIYALQHELDFAAVRNASGIYVKADLDSVTAAAKSALIPDNDAFGVSITDAAGKHVYPISTFTWLLVPVESRKSTKTAALRDLLRWVLTSGQRECEGLGYAPLPGEFASRELQALSVLH